MKKILTFIRFVNTNFEKVSWYKNTDGTKSVVKEMYFPTPAEALQIAQSFYGELTISNN